MAVFLIMFEVSGNYIGSEVNVMLIVQIQMEVFGSVLLFLCFVFSSTVVSPNCFVLLLVCCVLCFLRDTLNSLLFFPSVLEFAPGDLSLARPSCVLEGKSSTIAFRRHQRHQRHHQSSTTSTTSESKKASDKVISKTQLAERFSVEPSSGPTN